MRPFPLSRSAVLLLAAFAVVACDREAFAQPAATPQSSRTERLARRLTPLIEAHKGKVGVMIKHLPSGETFAYREREEMPTASLIKFPLLMAATKAIEEGKVTLDKPITLTKEDMAPGSGILTTHFSPGLTLSLRDAMRLMIAYSDNTATNLVIDAVGLEATSKLMEELDCPATRLHAKVFRRETSIAPERSAKFGLGSTSAADMVKLLEMLHKKEFQSAERCDQILEHLYACEAKNTIRRRLPPGTRVAHKTGAVNETRTDAGIIDTPAGAIAFCVLTTENADTSWGDTNAGEVLISEIGQVVYRHYVGRQREGRETPATADLKLGAQGEMVEALQRTLNQRLDPSPELSIDGDFGPATEQAVMAFRRQAKLSPGGEVDRRVWEALGPLVMTEAPIPSREAVDRLNSRRDTAESLDGPPVVTCKGWVLVDAKSGEKLAGGNEERLLDPASTTKIMTAYLVLKAAADDPTLLEQKVTFSRRADNTPGSTAAIKAGEVVVVEDLLYGLLLPSGNDASVALAEHFGAQWNPEEGESGYDRFITKMNETAKELGLSNTTYENPHGLTAPNHKTTPADLAQLARRAMELPKFREIVQTRQKVANLQSEAGYERQIVWNNTNQLLRRKGYLGVKTGTTDAAGACLVACGERDGHEAIGVVLGATSSDARYVDMRNLFRWVWVQQAVSTAEQAAETTDAASP